MNLSVSVTLAAYTIDAKIAKFKWSVSTSRPLSGGQSHFLLNCDLRVFTGRFPEGSRQAFFFFSSRVITLISTSSAKDEGPISEITCCTASWEQLHINKLGFHGNRFQPPNHNHFHTAYYFNFCYHDVSKFNSLALCTVKLHFTVITHSMLSGSRCVI